MSKANEPIQPCIAELVVTRPDIAVSVTRSHDETFRWDGDGPDPEEEGFLPHDVDVTARCIRNGKMYEGTASLGGSYFQPEEFTGEIHGYLPQMLEEAVKDLDAALPRGVENS